jgi:ribosomal 30S subunit maturation factor RimM
MEPPDGFILLGRLGKTFGLKGALHFRPLGPAEAEAILDLSEVFVAGLGMTAVREARPHGAGIVVTLPSARNPESARKLVNSDVYAHAESLPSDEGATHYVDALRGLPVLLAGRPLGTVANVFGPVGAELLAVERLDGHELLLPLQAPYVQVSHDSVLVVDPPGGLIDEDGDA